MCTHRIGFPPKSEISNDTNSRDIIINSVVAIAAMRVVVLKDSFIIVLNLIWLFNILFGIVDPVIVATWARDDRGEIVGIAVIDAEGRCGKILVGC